MLRLWPERRSLGLFAGHSWLSVGKRVLREKAGADSTALLDVADGLLLQQASAGWPRPDLDVLLSDEMARVVVLPWQDGLRTATQLMRYAEACLDEAGALRSNCTVQYGYRRFGAAGIAFAVQTDTLQQLSALAMARRLNLRSVLPASVAAFWREAHVGAGERLILLGEAQRVSALRLARHGVTSLDVQPVIGTRELALSRLLRRVQLQAEDVDSIVCWSTDQGRAMEVLSREHFPKARVWRRPDGGGV